MKKYAQIPVVDLFAGPGGLGEGFSAYNKPDNHFKIQLSIEKDIVAHQTLTLRAFYRQFGWGNAPDEYYNFITSNKYDERKLYKLLGEFSKGAVAQVEALCLELGIHNNLISRKINEAVRNRIRENKPWVLIGGPPCQAYSLVGRARNKAKTGWSLETDDRSELYQEYLKILARYQPAVFVMENVKGMLSVELNGERLIDKITDDLKNPNESIKVKPQGEQVYEYKLYSIVKEHDPDEPFEPEDFLIKCENYRIPQKRHRVIILGVREDYNPNGNFNILRPADNYISVKNTIFDLPAVYSNFSARKKNLSNFDTALLKYESWVEMLRDFFRCNDIGDSLTKKVVVKYLGKLKNNSGRNPRLFNSNWFYNTRLNGHICNHEPRTHIRSDFLRYFFVSCFGEAHNRSPKLEDFPKILLPAHKNADSDTFVDRFKVQLKNEPSATVTCHISKDGHYYIHPDPRQCRSLTVREAARLQTFPDDYFFCGNRTQQYHQVGNAVPPLLARNIAGIIYQILKKSGKF